MYFKSIQQPSNENEQACIDYFIYPTSGGERATLSIEEPISDLPKISVYPNPAQENIIIETKTPIKSIRIFNNLGQEFNLPASFYEDRIQIDIRSLPTGIYYISSSHDGGEFKSTFIKH